METFSLWHDVILRIHAYLSTRGRSVRDCRVLLPHPSLLSPAIEAWKQHSPNSYVPRFCTLNAWVQESGQWQPAMQDLAFSPYQDAQTARQLLARIRGAHVQTPWPEWLIKNTCALASAAAAVAPEQRQAWYTKMQALLFPASTSPWGATEQMLLQTALAWAGHSRYASDALWSDLEQMRVHPGRSSLVIVTGVQSLTPLEKALLAQLGSNQTLHLSLPALQAESEQRCAEIGHKASPALAPLIRVFETASAYDEAAIAAHCVLSHVMAQRSPVALVAIDRQQVRHIQAMLRSSGLHVRDETGWLLSTSAGAGRLLAILQACQAEATASDCLHALRAMPKVDARAADGLEQQARQHRWRTPAQLRQAATSSDASAADGWLQSGLALLEHYRAKTRARDSALAWLRCVHELLVETGLREWLEADPEGQSLLDHLPEDPLLGNIALELDQQQMQWSFADWLTALRETLEAAAYIPDAPATGDVCILPLHHLPGRNFAAAVLPGCSDQTLPAVPKPMGFWGQKQRSILGLPTHSDEALTQKTAFECALRWPQVDLLWARSGSDGQPRFASPLLQSALQGCMRMPKGTRIESSPDPRPVQLLPVRPCLPPQASAAHRLPKRLSATAYSDLRTCPYRFFAMRMLGLRPIKPLDEQADARDQGQWLHAVLKNYHESRARAGWSEVVFDRDLRLLNELSRRVMNEMQLNTQDMWHLWHQKEALFEAYLRWQQAHEADAYQFQKAETWLERALGGTLLYGQIDRVDTQSDRAKVMLIDYKLSKAGRVKERLKADAEDVQLPFYALLQRGEDADEGMIAAAFVSLHAQEGVSTVPMPHLSSRARRLAAGITQDMARIAQGNVLRATGQEQACAHCEARGLCRKDDWT